LAQITQGCAGLKPELGVEFAGVDHPHATALLILMLVVVCVDSPRRRPNTAA
jgi:hypothetical protein